MNGAVFDPVSDNFQSRHILYISKTADTHLKSIEKSDKKGVCLYLGKLYTWLRHPSTHMKKVFYKIYDSGNEALNEENLSPLECAKRASKLEENLRTFYEQAIEVHNSRRFSWLTMLHLAGIHGKTKMQDRIGDIRRVALRMITRFNESNYVLAAELDTDAQILAWRKEFAALRKDISRSLLRYVLDENRFNLKVEVALFNHQGLVFNDDVDFEQQLAIWEDQYEQLQKKVLENNLNLGFLNRELFDLKIEVASENNRDYHQDATSDLFQQILFWKADFEVLRDKLPPSMEDELSEDTFNLKMDILKFRAQHFSFHSGEMHAQIELCKNECMALKANAAIQMDDEIDDIFFEKLVSAFNQREYLFEPVAGKCLEDQVRIWREEFEEMQQALPKDIQGLLDRKAFDLAMNDLLLGTKE